MAQLYKTLQEGQFRVVRISPSLPPHVIECTLYNVTLDARADYTACSYTWGHAEFPELAPAEQKHRDPVEIIVDGIVLPVTPNLFDMLLQLSRSFSPQVHYWIDALCINQDDDIEKTTQVNLMDQIYSFATSVIIWLGLSNDGTPGAISIIDQIDALSLPNFDPDTGLPTYDVDRVRDLYGDIRDPLGTGGRFRLGLPDATEADWLELMKIYQRRWFKRIWTVQESGLARAIFSMIGKHEILWRKLFATARFLCDLQLGNSLIELAQRRLQFNDIGFPILSHMLSQMWITGHASQGNELNSLNEMFAAADVYENPTAIWDRLLWTCRELQATDPRDKIFGMLGLLKRIAEEHGREPLAMVADYRMQVEEVFKLATIHLMKSSSSSAFLSRIPDQALRNVASHPSWTIDFTADTPRSIHSLYHHQNLSRMSGNNALAGIHTADARFKFVGDSLHLKFLPISRVQRVGDNWNDICSTGDFEATAAIAIAVFEKRSYNVVEDLMTAMLCGISDYRSITYTKAELLDSFRAFLLLSTVTVVINGLRRGIARSETLMSLPKTELLAGLDTTRVVPTCKDTIQRCEEIGILEDGFGQINTKSRDKLLLQAQPFGVLAKNAMKGRRTLLLANGMMGMGGESTQLGDSLCIVPSGARAPFLFRDHNEEAATSASGKRKRFVSEAYVKELMDASVPLRMLASGATFEAIEVI